MLFYLMFHYDLMRKSNGVPAGVTVCVELVRSPHVCVGFRQGRLFPPTSQR